MYENSKQTQLYLDIPNIGETRVELRLDHNVFQNQVYAQREGLVVYGDREINRVAGFTEPEDLKYHPQNQGNRLENSR